MGVNLYRGSHVVFFIIVLPALSLLSAWLFSLALQNPPFWLETLSPLAAYGLLFTLFDRYLWSWKIFRLLGIALFPDLRGRWKGNQMSSYKVDGKNVVVDSFLEIRQTFSHVSVCAYYQKSNSASMVASFAETDSGNYLFYTYDNEPQSLQEGTMQNHKGTVKLRWSPDNKLTGSYFNSIGNKGDMEFSFEGASLLRRFKK